MRLQDRVWIVALFTVGRGSRGCSRPRLLTGFNKPSKMLVLAMSDYDMISFICIVLNEHRKGYIDTIGKDTR